MVSDREQHGQAGLCGGRCAWKRTVGGHGWESACSEGNNVLHKNIDSESIDAVAVVMYLAKKDDKWLTEAQADPITLNETRQLVKAWAPDGYYGKNFTAKKGDVHMVAVVPEHALSPEVKIPRKRDREEQSIADDTCSIQTKRLTLGKAQEEAEPTTYFTMKDFRPMIHPAQKYKQIMVRKSYEAICAPHVDNAETCFKQESERRRREQNSTEPKREEQGSYMAQCRS